MFEHLKVYRSVIVTGPHRSGTTICAEMVGHDTGLAVYREEEFKFRDIVKAEPLIRKGGVFQGPYLLPWIPILADKETFVIYMQRTADEVDASVRELQKRGISTPFFSRDQARRLWGRIDKLCPHGTMIAYQGLQSHPLWRSDRNGWGHRQTC